MKDDRLISLNAALDVLHGYFDGMLETDTVCPKDLYNEIEALPSAQRWIPCKTALPDDDTEVIVSCTDDSGDYEFSYVTTGWHYKGLWVVNNERCYFVRAWQPLPESYKEEQP